MRAFVAIELSEKVRAALAREQSRLQAVCGHNPDIRWTRPDGLHLTLKFLGEIPAEQVLYVTAALEALDPFEKFEVEVKGFGFFPDALHPRVFWAGFDAPAALAHLGRSVETALEKLGFAREDRPFRPHLTLARFRTPRAERTLAAAVEEMDSTSFGRFEVREFFLFESHLLTGGAEYRKVARFPDVDD
ncbi:MAG TPA: RNA 2',3'-cyclic phosphodiesterase [Terriglobia bacterium]